jgi:hypothetical protein
MQAISSLLSLAPPTAALRTTRRTAPSARRASLRVVAHGGVGGSGGTAYEGKDKPFGSGRVGVGIRNLDTRSRRASYR